MRNAGLIASAFILSACASLGAGSSGVLDAGSERGRSLAERRCAGCHAVGLDERPMADGPRFRDLARRYNAISLQRRFVEISQHGSGEMPPVQISQSDAEDLVAYLGSLERP